MPKEFYRFCWTLVHEILVRLEVKDCKTIMEITCVIVQRCQHWYRKVYRVKIYANLATTAQKSSLGSTRSMLSSLQLDSHRRRSNAGGFRFIHNVARLTSCLLANIRLAALPRPLSFTITTLMSCAGERRLLMRAGARRAEHKIRTCTEREKARWIMIFCNGGEKYPNGENGSQFSFLAVIEATRRKNCEQLKTPRHTRKIKTRRRRRKEKGFADIRISFFVWISSGASSHPSRDRRNPSSRLKKLRHSTLD